MKLLTTWTGSPQEFQVPKMEGTEQYMAILGGGFSLT